MDTKTLNLNFGEGEADKIREVLRRMGEFIAYFEVAENKMAQWKEDLETMMQQNQASIQEQVQDIREATEELRDIMTETGAARWRIAAEQALAQGKDHLKALENLGQQHIKSLEDNNEQFSRLAKKSFDRLDRACTYTIKNISEAVGSFKLSEFQKLTEQSCEAIEKTSVNTIQRLRDLVKWFHWKNLGLATAITLVTSIIVGLYLNDEMPWEIHKQVALQRHAGQALINAWPNLSQVEQQRIIEKSKKDLI